MPDLMYNSNFLKVALKQKYKYRLVVEESMSFGILGKRGAGVTDFYQIEVLLNQIVNRFIGVVSKS